MKALALFLLTVGTILSSIGYSQVNGGHCRAYFIRFERHPLIRNSLGRDLFDNHQEPEVIRYLADKEVLFVGGVGFDYAVMARQPYFTEHAKWLADRGITHRFAPTRSFNDVFTNGQIIVNAIRSSAKPVFIISHSRGGADTLEALRSLAQQTQQLTRISGWVSLQAPFWGARAPENIYNKPSIMQSILNAGISILRGHANSLRELSISSRVRYMKDHAEIIDRILASIPTVTYGSTATLNIQNIGLLKRFFPEIFQPNNSDGTIEIDSTFISGIFEHSFHVVQDSVSHRETVMSVSRESQIDRGDFLNDILTAWLQFARRQE